MAHDTNEHSTTGLENPKDAGAKPPYQAGAQTPPGSEAEMTPTADHGEESYIGTGRLKGWRAVITEGDSGIGRSQSPLRARAQTY